METGVRASLYEEPCLYVTLLESHLPLPWRRVSRVAVEKRVRVRSAARFDVILVHRDERTSNKHNYVGFTVMFF